LVDELRARGFEGAVDAAIDLSSAVREADIVSTATLATEPLIHGALLRARTHLDLIGGFTPAMREADDACFGWDVGLWVDTGEALTKSGDLLGPMSRGVFSAGDVRGTLADLVRMAGRRCPRSRGNTSHGFQVGRYGAGGSRGGAVGRRARGVRH
jgi:ornithine cyclodeaminase/alanine dehydrogenase-like protein (mu-crystallin family)